MIMIALSILRRIFLQVMIAFALSAAELGRREGVDVRTGIVRMIPPDPLYPPRYLPVRRRPLYDDGEVAPSHVE